MSKTPTVSVIIVNYNTREMTLKCLSELYENTQDLSYEVWVVDNASQDGSVEAIRERFPQVHVLANEQNAGFGAANNRALREARGEYLLLLNSDAFVHPGALNSLVAFMEREPNAAVVGPRLLNADGTLQHSCFRFPTPVRAWLENLWISALFTRHPALGDYRRWDHDAERKVDFVSGACMLVRRDAYKQVGGFDETFFMYSEETDWQRRMRARGWDITFTPAAVVTHLGGASGANERARINRHFFDSLDHYELKHHGLAGLVSVRAAMTLGSLLRALLWGAVAVVDGKRRPVGISKVRLYLWLLLRQTTHWTLNPHTS